MTPGNNMKATELKAAEETYSGFVEIVKWSSAITAITVAIVVVLIA